MLDRETAAVLNVLNQISDGSFKVVDADDLITRANTAEKLTRPALAAIIRKLAEHDLIKIKTSTMEMYVIATTPKARLAEEKIVQEAVEKNVVYPAAVTVTGGKEKGKTAVARAAVPNVDIKILKRAMFRSAMAGALVGGALITALAVVLVVVLFII